MRDVADLEPNPEKPGWYRGLVVVNIATGDVHGIYRELLEAYQVAKRLGPDFQALGGGYCPAADLFEYFESPIKR